MYMLSANSYIKQLYSLGTSWTRRLSSIRAQRSMYLNVNLPIKDLFTTNGPEGP